MSEESKRLSIHEETFDRLSQFKDSGETWDDVIWDLIKARQKQNLQEMVERTDDDQFVALEGI